MADSTTTQELKALLAGDRQPVLIDVRRKADFDVSPKRIGYAQWRNPEEVDRWSQEIPEDREVIVYCVKGGSVSQSIAGRLRERLPNVKFLQGGIKAWTELGEPVQD